MAGTSGALFEACSVVFVSGLDSSLVLWTGRFAGFSWGLGGVVVSAAGWLGGTVTTGGGRALGGGAGAGGGGSTTGGAYRQRAEGEADFEPVPPYGSIPSTTMATAMQRSCEAFSCHNSFRVPHV